VKWLPTTARSPLGRAKATLRYVEGPRIQITSVLHPWKIPDQHGLGSASKIVLTMEIEDSDRRSDQTHARRVREASGSGEVAACDVGGNGTIPDRLCASGGRGEPCRSG
jgi:hypothetical protein